MIPASVDLAMSDISMNFSTRSSSVPLPELAKCSVARSSPTVIILFGQRSVVSVTYLQSRPMQVAVPRMPKVWIVLGNEVSKEMSPLKQQRRSLERHRGNPLSFRAVISILSQRLLHKMTNSKGVFMTRLHLCWTARLGQETPYLQSWPKCVGHCAFFPNCCYIRSLPPSPPPPPPPPPRPPHDAMLDDSSASLSGEQHCMGGGGGGGRGGGGEGGGQECPILTTCIDS